MLVIAGHGKPAEEAVGAAFGFAAPGRVAEGFVAAGGTAGFLSAGFAVLAAGTGAGFASCEYLKLSRMDLLKKLPGFFAVRNESNTLWGTAVYRYLEPSSNQMVRVRADASYWARSRNSLVIVTV